MWATLSDLSLEEIERSVAMADMARMTHHAAMYMSDQNRLDDQWHQSTSDWNWQRLSKVSLLHKRECRKFERSTLRQVLG
jgi:hypothetical protein